MAFASLNTLGAVGSTSNNQASLSLTTSAAAEADNVVVVLVAVDNNATVDGDDLAVSGVAASGQAFTKAVQFANTGGALAAGTSCSIWYRKLTATLASGSTIVATFTTANNSDETAISAWEFSIGAGMNPAVEATATLANDNAAQGSLNATTANIACLRVRAIASESATATALTPTSTWAIFTQALSGGAGVAAQAIRGEWLISTATGAASAPTGGAGAVNHASVYAAFKEVLAPTAGPRGAFLCL